MNVLDLIVLCSIGCTFLFCRRCINEVERGYRNVSEDAGFDHFYDAFHQLSPTAIYKHLLYQCDNMEHCDDIEHYPFSRTSVIILSITKDLKLFRRIIRKMCNAFDSEVIDMFSVINASMRLLNRCTVFYKYFYMYVVLSCFSVLFFDYR